MKNFNQSTKLCEILGVSLPIVQAPMNNATNAALVAAVSNAGGMGVLGPNAGRDAENLNTKERYKREFERIKSLTDKPYGVNIVCLNDNNKKYALKVIETAFETGVKAFFFVGIVETELFKFIKDNGGVLVHRALTPSANSARAAQEEGADIIIATGYDEGGVGPQNKIGTFSIVPIIADAVSVPVMAAGGINDIRGVRAAFALGASGVYVGTRFIASTECPAAQPAKESIVSMGSSELFFVSDYQRVVPSKFAKELNAMYLNGDKEVVAQKIERLNPLRLAMIDGDIENGIIYVNSGISLIKEIKSAKKIVGELMADFV
nr:nitronate monooxygenase [uncultured Campylobacter sp.]